ncbi:protease Do-like 1, chloroplastic [Apium graveolens]|uniref:protease Do-like 1, chloroplastic n=1 Tax=Apium graveolens TaxID=4045 RepID=UPI003D7A6195
MAASALSLTCNFSFHSHPFNLSLKTTPSCSYTLRRQFKTPNYYSSICSALCNNNNNQDSSNFQKKFLQPFLVATTSLALSFTLFLTDVDSASAFVVTTPRKLQTDELATVRLFQENTPSVVYITNLAVKQDAFTLDVLEVPQGSGSGFVWDKKGHIVTNYHVIRGASDLRFALLPPLARLSLISNAASDLPLLLFC